MLCQSMYYPVLFFNDTATTEIYTLSLHDALPISCGKWPTSTSEACYETSGTDRKVRSRPPRDRKSTRLNSSHTVISYAVFCLKKKITDENAQANEYLLGV